jgi:hypothetical protein
MGILNTQNLRSGAKLLSMCAAAFALAMGGVYFAARLRAHPEDVFRKRGGYDFGRHMNQDWSGPSPGERLDLGRFSGPAGEKITDSVSGDILMLATIDPDCPGSWVARDELYDVRALLSEARVPYVLVSATTNRPPDEFYKYAASLGVNAPAYMWSSKEGAPPESLFTMTVPSHLLVRRDGTILRTWPGTRNNQKLRFQMVNQIVADTLEIASDRR